MIYQVTARRDGDAYTAEVGGMPGCHTFAASWGELCERVRELIGLWVGSSVSAAEIHIQLAE